VTAGKSSLGSKARGGIKHLIVSPAQAKDGGKDSHRRPHMGNLGEGERALSQGSWRGGKKRIGDILIKKMSDSFYPGRKTQGLKGKTGGAAAGSTAQGGCIIP